MKLLKLSLITTAVAVLSGCATVRPTADVEIVDPPRVTENITRDFDQIRNLIIAFEE